MRGVLSTILLLSTGLSVLPAEPVDQIVIVANANVQDSLELAAHYAAVRGISTNRICRLDLPRGETMSRGFYETRLRDPFLAFLRDRGLVQQVQRPAKGLKEHDTGWTTMRSDIRFVALMYGVPLRVADSHALLGPRAAALLDQPMARNDAAVESELALALAQGFDPAGRIANIFYDQYEWQDLGKAAQDYLMVTRLDGPGKETVRRMIDDAVAAEKSGLWGRVYVDARGLRDTGYLVGDRWLRESATRLEREGYPVLADLHDPVWGPGFPMELCAFYAGWYAERPVGPLARADFRFMRGAFAYHNHSGNAKSVRDPDVGWVSTLLARGACCTMGAVAEPYLTLTPNLQVFTDRWLSGLTFAESAFMALPALSWQITVVGDPLYRPFSQTLEQRMAALERNANPDVEWAWLQTANRLVLEGRVMVALSFIRERLRRLDSVVLRARLADLCLLNELFGEAEKEYRMVCDRAATPETAFSAGGMLCTLLRARGRGAEADELARSLIAKYPGSPYRDLVGKAGT